MKIDEHILDSDESISHNFSKKYRQRVFVWGVVLVIGILFKILRLDGSALMILASSGVLFVKGVMGVKEYGSQFKLALILAFLGAIWLLVLLWGNFFNNGYPYNLDGLAIFTTTCVISFIYQWYRGRMSATL